jgi:hypothetical protein
MEQDLTSVVILIVAIVAVFEFFHIGYLVNRISKVSLAVLEAVDKPSDGQKRCRSCFRLSPAKETTCRYCKSYMP